MAENVKEELCEFVQNYINGEGDCQMFLQTSEKIENVIHCQFHKWVKIKKIAQHVCSDFCSEFSHITTVCTDALVSFDSKIV